MPTVVVGVFDAWAAAGVGLGGVDLTDGATQDAIQIDIISIDQGNITLTFTVTDLTGGETSTLVLAGLGVGTQAVLFSSFTGIADFTDIDSIVLTIDAGVASDLILDLIDTRLGTGVGLPTTLALLGLGLFGVIRRREHNIQGVVA